MRGSCKDGARDGDTLPFATRKACAALAHDCVVPFGQPRDKVVRVGRLGSADDLLGGGIGLAIGNVLREGTPEEKRLTAGPCRSDAGFRSIGNSRTSMPSMRMAPPVTS